MYSILNTMLKRLFCSFVTIAMLSSASAQGSIEKLFYTMPGDLLWLDKAQRTELFAFYKDKGIDSIPNKLNGYCKITDYDETSQHLRIRTSTKGSLELIVFTAHNETSVLGVISTVCAPACSSSISFYTMGWNPIEVSFPSITASDFLKEGLTEDQKLMALGFLSPLLVSYQYNKQTKEIVAICNAEHFLSEYDWKELSSLLKTTRLTLSLQSGEWKIKL